jgi:Tol biopolymer transport system component
VAADGSIYFGSGGDIWVSKPSDDAYTEAERLDSIITTSFREGHPCIAPDQSFLIFATDGYPDSPDGPCLRISFKDHTGRWCKPVRLERNGQVLRGICPVLSPDGKYLFFNSMSTGATDIYWVDAGMVDVLRRSVLSE